MELNELKPCPFCGGEGKLRNHWESIGMGANVEQFYVRCEDCGSCGGVIDEMFFKGDLKSMAIKAWNRRAENGKS